MPSSGSIGATWSPPRRATRARLRCGELLGLHALRVNLRARCIEVLDVRYDAGRFGTGYKPRPKSDSSIRLIPMAPPVIEAIHRRLAGCPPDGLVFCGPGGSSGVRRGERSRLSGANYRRVYKLAGEAAGLAHLQLKGPYDLRHTSRPGWRTPASRPG